MGEAIEIVVQSTPQIVEVGFRGAQGPSPERSEYDQATVAPVAGVLTLDMSDATVFLVPVNQAITSIAFTNWPTDRAATAEIWFEQAGGFPVAGWPSMKWPGGNAPANVTPTAGAIDIVVVKHAFGKTIGALAASNILGT